MVTQNEKDELPTERREGEGGAVTQDVESHEKFSAGFDSGRWEEGEAAIREALK